MTKYEDLKITAIDDLEISEIGGELRDAEDAGIIGYTSSENIPGVILRDDMPVYEVAPGKFYTVTGAVVNRKGKLVPIVKMPLIDGKKREGVNERGNDNA